MGRSSKQQMAENRERIVDSATKLFRQHGVAAVSLAQVMTAAGMTQGGFYKHFPSKDALAAEACTEAFKRSVDAWKEKASAGGINGIDALRELVLYYFSPKPPERTCPMVAFSQDASSNNPESGAQLGIAYTEGARRLFNAFAEVAGSNPSDPMSRDKISMIFTAMVGANLLARTTDDNAWIEQLQSVVLESIKGEESADEIANK